MEVIQANITLPFKLKPKQLLLTYLRLIQNSTTTHAKKPQKRLFY